MLRKKRKQSCCWLIFFSIGGGRLGLADSGQSYLVFQTTNGWASLRQFNNRRMMLRRALLLEREFEYKRKTWWNEFSWMLSCNTGIIIAQRELKDCRVRCEIQIASSSLILILYALCNLQRAPSSMIIISLLKPFFNGLLSRVMSANVLRCCHLRSLS